MRIATFNINNVNKRLANLLGWLKAAKLTMEGAGAERIRENVFEIHVPERREVPVRLSMTIPRVAEGVHPSVVPAAFMASPEPIKPPRGRGSDPIKERNARLAKIYGNRPLLIVQNFVPFAYETGLNNGRNQLFAPTSYVAFAINTKPEVFAGLERDAAGFPVVLCLAWIFDVQGGRLERTEGRRPGMRRLLLLAGIGVLAAAPGLVWYFGFRGRSQTPSPSIVVLPFANLSGAAVLAFRM